MMILICKESFIIPGEYLILPNQVKYSPGGIRNCLSWTLINEVLQLGQWDNLDNMEMLYSDGR